MDNMRGYRWSSLLIGLSIVGSLFILIPAGQGIQSPPACLILLICTTTLGFFVFEHGGVGTTAISAASFLYGVSFEPGYAVLVSGVGMSIVIILRLIHTVRRPVDSNQSGNTGLTASLSRLGRSMISLTAAMIVYKYLGGNGNLTGNLLHRGIPLATSAGILFLTELGAALLEGRGYAKITATARQVRNLVVLISLPIGLAVIGVLAYSTAGLAGYSIYSLLLLTLIQPVWLASKANSADYLPQPVQAVLSDQIGDADASISPTGLYSEILDRAIQIVGAESGHLAIYKDDPYGLMIVAQHPTNLDDQGEAIFDSISSFSASVAELGHPRRHDLQAEGPLSNGEPRFALGIPLMDRTGILGVLTVERGDKGQFSQKQQDSLVRLASQSAASLRNALLYKQLEQRLTEQSLLYQASMQIAETLEPEAVALAAADSTCVALKADWAAVYRWDPDRERLVCIASIAGGRPQTKLSARTLNPVEIPFLQTCLTERKVQRWCTEDAPSERDRQYLLVDRQAACLLVVPLTLGERTLGILEATTLNPSGFTASADWTAQSIAIQTAIALENTELFQWTRAGHDRLMAILNSSREGIMMIDLAGHLLMVNKLAGEMIGIDRKQLENHTLDDPALELESHLGYEVGDIQRLLGALGQHTTYYARSKVFEPTGRDHNFLQRNESPVFDSDGDLIGWLIVLRDVSEQRELEQSRHHLTEMIVHDLRGPLTAILSGLTLLKTHIDEGTDSPIVAQALTISERSVQQMLGLVDSLLTISKLEGGSANLRLELTDPTLIVREIAEIYVPEANKAGIVMRLDLEQIPDLELDREKIARVVGNLIDNALKFTPAGGQIGLELKLVQGFLALKVSDTGPGVPMEYRDKIFDRYAQVPGVSGRRRGTGIGLAFCKLTVEAHGGRIWVDDDSDGGSAFIIRIPIHHTRAVPSPDSN